LPIEVQRAIIAALAEHMGEAGASTAPAAGKPASAAPPPRGLFSRLSGRK
jgi:hypothetical protein